MPPKTSASKAQEKVEFELRKLTRLDGNKTCVDCPEKMPGYVNLTHHTFVCTRCSGIHRELQFKVKGISMSVFTAEDVSDVAAMGNAAHNAVYMAKFQSKDISAPNGTDVAKLREFIKNKYLDKKWFASTNSSANDSHSKISDTLSGSADNTTSDSGDLWGKKQSSTSRVTSVVKEQIAKPVVTAAPTTDFGLDLLSLDSSPPPKPQVTQMQHQFNSASESAFSGPSKGSFDAFGGQNAPGGFDAFGGQQTSIAFDAFGSSIQPQPAAQKPSTGAFDAFSSPQLNKAVSSQQGGFGDFNGFSSSPTPPMPFIKVAPPTAEEKAAEEAILAATLAKAPPPPKNFNVFDEIVSTPPVMHGYGAPRGYPGPAGPYGVPPMAAGNPFDIPGQAANPFGGPPAGYGAPVGNPFGAQMPPQGPYQPAPQGFYPGMPPPGQGMPLPPQMPFQGPGTGMPYGFHPQGPPGPYGYAPQYPPQGYPPHGFPPSVPPQPFGPSGSTPYSAPQPVVIVPKEPAKPDPFSTVAGVGWGEVSKPTNYQPTTNTISASYHPPATKSTSPSSNGRQQSDSHFDPYQMQSPVMQVTSPKPPAPPAESGNPFDMF